MAKKFQSGDCIDIHSITEAGEKFWDKGWRIERPLEGRAFRLLRAKGDRYDGAVTWSISSNIRKSNKCKRTLSEAKSMRRK